MIGPGKSCHYEGVDFRGIKLKTYSERKIELRELKSRQFMSSDQPYELKSLDVALSIGGRKKEDVKNTHLKVATAVKSGGHLIWKGALVTVEVCVLCGWTFSNQFDIAL